MELGAFLLKVSKVNYKMSSIITKLILHDDQKEKDKLRPHEEWQSHRIRGSIIDHLEKLLLFSSKLLLNSDLRYEKNVSRSIPKKKVS